MTPQMLELIGVALVILGMTALVMPKEVRWLPAWLLYALLASGPLCIAVAGFLEDTTASAPRTIIIEHGPAVCECEGESK